MQVLLKNVRLAFPELFKASSFEAGQAAYFSVTLPIEPGSDNHKALEAAIEKVAAETWPKNTAAVLKAIRSKGDCSYKHEPKVNKDGDIYDGFDGMYTLRASRNAKKGAPMVINRDKSPLAETDNVIYAGCYVNVLVDIWGQEPKGAGVSRRVNADLMVVQFVKGGDSFGGGARISTDAFEELPAEETADDLA